MRTIYAKNTDAAVAELLRVTYPGCGIREVSVRIHDRIRPMSLASYWANGTRDHHAIVRLDDMKVVAIPENGSGYTPFDHNGSNVANVPCPGYAVVTWREGCVRALHIEIHEENATRLIAAPVEISWSEKVVLVATRSLKASYGGVKDFRFVNAHKETGITREEWDTAKTALIGRRLLNKAGAITVEGRNAAGTYHTRLRDYLLGKGTN